MEAFKKEAKALANSTKILHTRVLDIVAKKYNFKNYRTIKPHLTCKVDIAPLQFNTRNGDFF